MASWPRPRPSASLLWLFLVRGQSEDRPPAPARCRGSDVRHYDSQTQSGYFPRAKDLLPHLKCARGRSWLWGRPSRVSRLRSVPSAAALPWPGPRCPGGRPGGPGKRPGWSWGSGRLSALDAGRWMSTPAQAAPGYQGDKGVGPQPLPAITAGGVRDLTSQAEKQHRPARMVGARVPPRGGGAGGGAEPAGHSAAQETQGEEEGGPQGSGQDAWFPSH